MRQDLTENEWAQYAKDGYLALGPVMEADEVKALAQRMEDIMMGRIRYDDMLMQLDKGGDYADSAPQVKKFHGPTLNYRKIQDLEKDPLFLSFMQKDLFLKMCNRVYGTHAGISSWRAMFMNKPAHQGTILPWHQDGGASWGLDRDPLLTVWTALSPSKSGAGCVEVMPGSHRLGLLSRMGHTISEELVDKHCPQDKVVELPAKPGEAYLLHNWLLHRSGVNPTDEPRMAFSVNYMDSRTRHKKQPQFRFPLIFDSPLGFGPQNQPANSKPKKK